MKLVYLVDSATYQVLAPRLDALDRALNAFALRDADGRAEELRAALQERGIVPVTLSDDRQDDLRSSGALALLAKTHLDAAETRALRDFLGDSSGDVGAAAHAHMILLEP